MDYLSLSHKVHFAMEQLVPAGFQHQQVLKNNSSKCDLLLNIEETSNNKEEEYF